MIFLDAYALIAFVIGGPARGEVRTLIREGDVAIATANLAEALEVLQRRFDLPIDRSAAVVDPLFEGPLQEVALDRARARRAAELRATHYHRTNAPISLGDAILLGSCGSGDRIATPDPHVLAVAEIEELGRVPLPGQG